MQKRAYLLGLLLATAGCVGDWSRVGVDDAGATEADEAGASSEEDAASIPADDQEGPREPPIESDTVDASDGLDAQVEADATSDDAGTTGPDSSDGALEDEGDAAPARAAAIASYDMPCDEPGELACSAHNRVQKLACLSVNGQAVSKWMFNGSCDGATRCDTRLGVGQGTCQAITSRCVRKLPGAAICDGTTRKQCGLDLLDETANDCPAHSHCEGADAACVCDRGYMSSPSGCVDIPDCPANACTNGQCVDATESYSCTCNSGYRPAADGKRCEDIPDCKPGICGTGGKCSEGVNDYSCTCDSGYEKKPGQKACSDIDNCVGNPCMPGTCRDGLNAYTCSCTAPYEQFSWDGTNQLCIPRCEIPCNCGGCEG